MEADERILETEDIVSLQKTGHTLHSFFVPVEREAAWLEEVDSQRTNDGTPLALLVEERARIAIRLTVSPEDEEGALERTLEHRKGLLKQYADSVATRILEFNQNLAAEMAKELNERKSAIDKAEAEQDRVGLPRVYNPEHAERAIQIEHIYKSLGASYSADPSSRDEESEKLDVRSFIVHGRDHGTLYQLKNYLQNTLKLSEPVILHETPNLGKTLIEKFEREAEAVKLVFVLLTPDDKPASPDDSDAEKRRARQNVIFELGFFLGRLGRESGRVLLLHKGPIELPSDIQGIAYIDITNGIQSAGEDIRLELRGLDILK
jgi:predicted nucleotide-binding protein